MFKQILTYATMALAASFSHAQTWPTQVIKYIVPFPPGGATDQMSRPLVERLQQRLGQPVVVENIGGAGGAIGATRLAAAKPDGYVIGLGNSATHTITPHLVAKAPYDPITQFTPISLLNEYVNILVVNPNLPAKDLNTFLALARSRPNGLTYASSGNGSSNHLTSEMLAAQAKLKFTHVAYKGNSAALTDVMAGHTDWMFATVSEVLPYVQAGKLLALGTSGRNRDPLMPSVPSISDAVAGFEVIGFMGLFGPAGMPPDIVNRLNQEINTVLKSKEIVDRYGAAGMKATPSTPEQLAQRVKQDHGMWKRVIETAGIKAE